MMTSKAVQDSHRLKTLLESSFAAPVRLDEPPGCGEKNRLSKAGFVVVRRCQARSPKSFAGSVR